MFPFLNSRAEAPSLHLVHLFLTVHLMYLQVSRNFGCISLKLHGSFVSCNYLHIPEKKMGTGCRSQQN